MPSTIPIDNLYYLFSYAWDHFHEGEEVDISSTQCPDLANLLAKVLAAGRRSRIGSTRAAAKKSNPSLEVRYFLLPAES